MSHNIRFCFLLFLSSVSTSGFTEPINNSSHYWQCVTLDAANKQWSAQSPYQKVALNLAFAACKKESQAPATCNAAKANCDEFNEGRSLTPMWQCTALDQFASPWPSDVYAQRYDAALAAKAFCKQKSTIPDTCYVNMVTCRNKNGD